MNTRHFINMAYMALINFVEMIVVAFSIVMLIVVLMVFAEAMTNALVPVVRTDFDVMTATAIYATCLYGLWRGYQQIRRTIRDIFAEIERRFVSMQA